MWTFSIIPHKRPPCFKENVVWAMTIGVSVLGVTLAETQVPRHISLRYLHLPIQKLKTFKKSLQNSTLSFSKKR